MADRRAIWNVVALVATLSLSVVVAVVAVTKSERDVGESTSSPTPTPTPSPSQTPGVLDGDGPYLVYATEEGVFAYDVASETRTLLGRLDARPAIERSGQPGAGRMVAFPTIGGSVWSVGRRGLERVGRIPSAAGSEFDGAVVSPDDRRLATAALAPEPAVVLVDLRTGRSSVLDRSRRGQYPSEPLLPIAWSLGGTLLWQIPFCRCEAGSPGLYSLDLTNGASSRLAGTSSIVFGPVTVAPSAQALYYGTAAERRCRAGEAGPCERAPFTLRRIAAGRSGPALLRRATDASFRPAGISQDGRLLLVQRVDPETGDSRVELYTDQGDPAAAPRGIPAGAEPLALLPGDVVVVSLVVGRQASLQVVRSGTARAIVETSASEGSLPVYLGWLQ